MKEEQKNIFLDFAVNLNRIGEWVCDDYAKKKNRIDIVLDQQRSYITKFNSSLLSDHSQEVFAHFLKKYPFLEEEIRKNYKKNLNQCHL